MSAIDRRAFVTRSAIAAALAVLDPSALFAQTVRGQMDASGQFGSLLNRQEFDAAPRALNPTILARFASQAAFRSIVQSGTAPRFVLPDPPPVFMQGTNKSLGFPGSCEACSFGYGLGTYTASRGSFGFPIAERNNHISVAWLFSWAQRTQAKTTCKGSLALPYLGLLIAEAPPSAAQVPYKPDCAYIDGISTSTGYSENGRFKIGSYKALPHFLNGQTSYLTLFKQYLNAGHAIAFSGLVAKGYANPSSAMYNGAFDPAPQDFITGSGHGQLIVGYDDSLGHTGAFLVQNSFGRDWPYLGSTEPLMQGRLYWTYEAFFASQGFGAVAYPVPMIPKYPRAGSFAPSESGAPVVRVLEAVRATDRGEAFVVLEVEFDQPMRLNSLRVTPAGAQSPIVGAYNAPIRYGFAHVTRKAGFPAGRYAVELDAHTLGSDLTGRVPVTYRGNLTIS